MHLDAVDEFVVVGVAVRFVVSITEVVKAGVTVAVTVEIRVIIDGSSV